MKCRWNGLFLSPALINRKEIRTIDSLLRYAGSRENSGNVAGDKSDNIFFGFCSDVLLTESQPKHTHHPRVRVHTYSPFVSLFTSYASTQTVGRAKQWAANTVVAFIFWKMEKHGWYVGRTSGRFQRPFPYLRSPLFPVSSLAIHHIFLLFYLSHSPPFCIIILIFTQCQIIFLLIIDCTLHLNYYIHVYIYIFFFTSVLIEFLYFFK